MPEQRAVRITISLPSDLIDLADRLAKERSMSRSGLIAQLLRNEKEAHIQMLMAQGYREMSQENRDEAEEAPSLTRVVVLRSS